MKVKLVKETDVMPGSDLTMCLHRGCGGTIREQIAQTPILMGDPALLQCNKCNKELHATWGDIPSFNKHLYIPLKQTVDTEKLTPVYKMVEVQNGGVRYSATMPLDDAGLLKYYGFSNWEVCK